MNHYVAGKNAVYEVLRAGRRHVHHLYISRKEEDEVVRQIIALARAKKIPITMDLSPRLAEAAGVQTHQGVLAAVNPFEYTPLDEVVGKALADPKGGFLLLCDRIQDPQNLGSLIRSAHLFGAHGVILPKHQSVDITPTVAKASAGAVEYLPIIKEANLLNPINLLKEKGFFVYGLSGEGSKSLYEIDGKGSVALVVGAEGKGIKNTILRQCDETIFIPMAGVIGSFNVSVAGAVAMAHFARVRKVPGSL